MKTVNPNSIEQMRFAVVLKDSSTAVSLHQHPDAAERFRKTMILADDFEVVELADKIGWKRF